MKLFVYFVKFHLYHFIYFISRSKRLKEKYKKYKSKMKMYCPEEGSWKVSFLSKTKRHYLIVGRLQHWDSLAKHTYFFLEATDLKYDEVYVYDEDRQFLLLCLGNNQFKEIKKLPIFRLDVSNFDMMIYTSPLTHNNLSPYHWETIEYLKTIFPQNRAALNFAYLVWDGTIAHPRWVELINLYFDAVFTPQEHLKQAFIQSGVQKPVFSLLNSFSYENFRSEAHHSLNRPFIFGWNGTFEKRKNVEKVVKAFIKAFGDSKDVLLHLHMRYLTISKETDEYKNFTNLVLKHPNIILDMNQLSIEDNIKLMKSYDAYVFPSMAEGYSVTPREALACGHSLILSDIKTHQGITDLKEEDGVFWIHASKPIIIHQLDMDLGYQYDCKEDEIVKAMKKLYANRKNLYKTDKIQKRQQASLKYDALNVSKYFETVLHTKNIELTDKNEIQEKRILTDSKNLYQKWMGK